MCRITKAQGVVIMSDYRIFVTIIPEVIVFLGIGIFVIVTKKVDILTLPGFKPQNMTHSEIVSFSKGFFVRGLISSIALIVSTIVLEILIKHEIISFSTSLKIMLPIIFIIIISCAISWILLGIKYSK